MIAQQLEHPLDEARHQQRHVATRGIGRLDVVGQRRKPADRPSSGPRPSRAIARHDHACGQRRQRLVRRSHHHDRLAHLAQQPHDPLQHQSRDQTAATASARPIRLLRPPHKMMPLASRSHRTPINLVAVGRPASPILPPTVGALLHLPSIPDYTSGLRSIPPARVPLMPCRFDSSTRSDHHSGRSRRARAADDARSVAGGRRAVRDLSRQRKTAAGRFLLGLGRRRPTGGSISRAIWPACTGSAPA